MITTAEANTPRTATEIQTATAAVPKRPRLEFVDGMRGFASLTVLIAHSFFFSGGYVLTIGGVWVSKAFGWGTFGVNLFLVISGFSLAYGLIQPDGSWKKIGIKDFFIRRAIRILPPYYAAILIFSLAGWFMPLIYKLFDASHYTHFHPFGLAPVLAHGLLVANITYGLNHNFPLLNGSFWSLEVEVQFYLLFPLLIYVVRRFGIFNMMGGVLVLNALWRMATWNLVAPSGDYTSIWEWTWNGPGRMFEFALGILAAYILVRYPNHISPTMCMLLGGLILWLGYSYMYVREGPFSPLSDIMLGTGFFFLILSASKRGLMYYLFTWRPLLWLGAFSYSLYLIHEPVMVEMLTWFGGRQGWAAFFTYTIGMASVIIVLAYFFYRAFEKPTIGWGRRYSQWRQRTAPPPPDFESPVTANTSEQHAAP